MAAKLLDNVTFTNVTAQGREAGSIDYARNWTMRNVMLQTADGDPVKIANSVNVAAPEVVTQR